MVHHEAAEAMGAISSVQSIPTSKEFLNDERREVRETCEIARAKVEWDNSAGGKAERTKYQEENLWVHQYTFTSPTCGFIYFLQTRQFTSEDPAPALPSSLLRPSSRSSTSYIDADVSTLNKTPLDPSLSLFVRRHSGRDQRALFSPALAE